MRKHRDQMTVLDALKKLHSAVLTSVEHVQGQRCKLRMLLGAILSPAVAHLQHHTGLPYKGSRPQQRQRNHFDSTVPSHQVLKKGVAKKLHFHRAAGRRQLGGHLRAGMYLALPQLPAGDVVCEASRTFTSKHDGRMIHTQ